MWIIHEPKKVALWNKRHFEEKNGDCVACLKYSVLIFAEKIYKMQHLEGSSTPVLYIRRTVLKGWTKTTLLHKHYVILVIVLIKNFSLHLDNIFFKQSSATRNKCLTQLDCARAQVTNRGPKRFFIYTCWSWTKTDIPVSCTFILRRISNLPTAPGLL
jgi:hypothetical protein